MAQKLNHFRRTVTYIFANGAAGSYSYRLDLSEATTIRRLQRVFLAGGLGDPASGVAHQDHRVPLPGPRLGSIIIC